jgi:hypothetical protein
MQIEGNLKGTTFFTDIATGSLFVYNDRLYMKIAMHVGSEAYGVNVETGEAFGFLRHATVEPRTGVIRLV